MNVVNWNSYYNNKGKNSISDMILRTISLWAAIGLLWLSFFKITEVWMWPCKFNWWLFVPWLFLLWALYEVVFPRLKKWKWMPKAFPWLNALLVIAFLVIKVMEDNAGLMYIIGRYLEFFNDFYFTNIVVDGTGGRYSMGPILTGLVMLLWLLFWGLSYSTKKRGVLGGFGATALVATLIIGMGPGKTGALCLLIAMILLYTCDIKGIFIRVAVPALLAISLLLTSWFFKADIDKLANSSDKLIEWEQGLDFEKIDLSNWGTDFNVGSEHLDNSKPNHTGRDILYIYADYIPTTSMYFRGFYGTNYVDGSWQLEDTIYAQACAEAGYSQEDTGKIISNLVLEVLQHGGNATKADYDVEYLGGIGDVAYIPYYFDYKTLNGNYDFSGDYLVSKPTMEMDMSFKGIREGDLLKDPSDFTQYVKDMENREFRKWYNGIAAQYTQVPDGIGGIEEAVELLQQYVTDKNDSYKPIEGDTELHTALVTNYHRNELVNLVKAYLDEVLSYSTMLTALPNGVDAVEYALTESHRGYCMHYASAAALILRELGVPTRYASGYVVQPEDFKYSQESRSYVALVEDYSAHAWVEVYYEYIGWVPVEVTAAFTGGSGLDDFQSLEELDPNRTEEENPDENQGQENPDENQGQEENPDENQGQEENPDENQGQEENPDENQGQEENPDENQNPDEQPEEDPDKDVTVDEPVKDKQTLPAEVWYVGGAVIFGLLCAVVIGLLIRREKSRKTHLETSVSQKECRKAVRRMNRHIYQMLRWKNLGKVNKVPLSGYLTDREYEEVLKDTFNAIAPEDWEEYMVIVKKMYYSQEVISEEEMLHCYKCYKNPQMKLWAGKKRKE